VWDGHSFSVADIPHPFETENLYGVAASSPTDVWAVGSGRDGEGVFHTIALHYDGDAWEVVPTANPGARGNVLYGVVANACDDVWAVGQRVGHEGPDQALVEHFNGRRFTEVRARSGTDASTQLIAVAAAGGDIRAVGDAQDGVDSLRTFAAASEHGVFKVQTADNPSTGDNRLAGIAAVNDDETWAVGNYLDVASGAQRTLIVSGGEGAPWTQAPSPNPSQSGDNQLGGVTLVGGAQLWAVGAFDGDSAKQTLIIRRCE
jgi:hypothetical protein